MTITAIDPSNTPNNASGSTKRIAFIQACWHKDIVDQCKQGFLAEMVTLCDHEIDIIEVPGAFEIPLQAKLLAKTGEYAAIIAAGLVVDGGIYRHEFVAQSVVSGLMQVQLETDVPVFSVVLTPHHFHDNNDHKSFFSEHFVKKGREAAQTCASILQLLDTEVGTKSKSEVSGAA